MLTSQTGSYVMPVYFPLYANNGRGNPKAGLLNVSDRNATGMGVGGTAMY